LRQNFRGKVVHIGEGIVYLRIEGTRNEPVDQCANHKQCDCKRADVKQRQLEAKLAKHQGLSM
jgi:hypothetical protein